MKTSPVGVIRRFILGDPLSYDQAEEQALPKSIALPIFSSDAISSVAYATQQIVLVLGAAGLWIATQTSTYGHYILFISLCIVALLAIVVTSYWQTVFGYPNGGGSYVVSRRNLGTFPGLIAAAALLIDYTLTVSVSIASGVQNLKDVPGLAFFHIADHPAFYCVLAIAILTLANLRGLKETGWFFAIPTYVFMFMCYSMILLGIIGPLIGWHFHLEYVNQLWAGGNATPISSNFVSSTPGPGVTLAPLVPGMAIFIVLQAFANGCSAMTGTEAISNGVPAFREPRARNAALTLALMGTILGTLFLGISWLAVKFHVVYWQALGVTAPAVIDQISGAVFGKEGPGSIAYLITQFFTASVLLLAANTSFAGFPRLASILAQDRFVPKQLANLGDKLVFHNGIILLGTCSALLIVLKQGNVDLLIPYYALGVFTAFTLSQAGMVRHWAKTQQSGWKRRATINAIGATATSLVLVIIMVEKFAEGAWAVILVAALLIWLFRKIHNHYIDTSHQLQTQNYHTHTTIKSSVILLVESLNAGTMQALDYARSLSPDCTAIHVAIYPERTTTTCSAWNERIKDVPLVVLKSPYRSLIAPLMEFLDSFQTEHCNDRITVIIPEFVPTKWWHSLLHGHTGLLLKFALLGRKGIVVANVRYYLH
jgi:amino acid transporter